MRAGAPLIATLLLVVGCGGAQADLPSSALDKRARKEPSWTPRPTVAQIQRPPFAPTPSRPESPAEERRLTNGARVVVVPRDDYPSVALTFALDRGKCDGPEAATLYSALATIGAAGSAEREDRDYLQFVGVFPRLEVSDESLLVHATALPPLATSALSRLAPMFFAPRIDDESIELAQESLSDLHDDKRVVEGTSKRTLRAILFGTSGHGSAVVDSKTLRATNATRVRAFRDDTFDPAHVTVVAVGKISTDEVVGTLERFTKGLSRTNARHRPSTCGDATPTLDHAARVIDNPGAVQSRIWVGARGPSANDADEAAVAVLAAGLGANMSSRLNHLVREAHGFSYGVTMHAQSFRAGGLITVETSVDAARSANALGDILAELDRAATTPLDPTELAIAKAAADESDGTHADEARAIALATVHGAPADARARWRVRIAAVTAADVARVASRYVGKEQRAIVVTGDAAAVAPSLESFGLGNVVVVRP